MLYNTSKHSLNTKVKINFEKQFKTKTTWQN